MVDSPGRTCRHCRAEMPADASVCATCRRSQGSGGWGCINAFWVLLIGAFVVFAVFGLMDPAPPSDDPAAVLKRDLDQAEEDLRNQIRDPESMMVRGMRRGTGAIGGYPTICGEVNSRNGFGGMTGWQSFVVVNRRAISGERGDMATLLAQAGC